MSAWHELGSRYLMNTIKRFPATMVRGQGVRLWDDQGREYLDFVSGWAVTSLGHAHPAMVEAITRQAQLLTQSSLYHYTVPQVQLAELLVKRSGLDRAFFCNSGAEAVEGAMKLARKYAKTHRNGAYEVISALNSFHGRTLAMTAATGQARYQEPYTPMPAGFINVLYNSIEAIKAATTEKTCAVLLEPIQGEGGVNVPDEDYLQQVRAWCDERGLLLILDEVQTGIGRTGTLFACEQFGVLPDIMTLAKGLGGGFPIGAFLAREHCSVFVPGDHGSTYGGNPLACAVAYAVVSYVLEHDLPGHVRQLGSHFMSRLLELQERFPMVSDVRGRGLLLAMEFRRDIADELQLACLERGLIVNRLKPNAIRFMPALIITGAEVDEGVDIVRSALEMVLAKEGK
ncbi:MAG: aspartate aminotransferase family protein [Chloroflexi bacterium]|nr:aspartate aminotransferase family protein [Chloroflexota bacterium]